MNSSHDDNDEIPSGLNGEGNDGGGSQSEGNEGGWSQAGGQHFPNIVEFNALQDSLFSETSGGGGMHMYCMGSPRDYASDHESLDSIESQIPDLTDTTTSPMDITPPMDTTPPPAMTDEQIEKVLKVSIYITQDQVEEKERCSLCITSYRLEEKLSQLPCSVTHIFHTKCIVPALKSKNECPLCRYKFEGLLPQRNQFSATTAII